MGTRGNIFLEGEGEGGGRGKVARKILLHKNMHMIRPTIHIFPLAFTYFILCL